MDWKSSIHLKPSRIYPVFRGEKNESSLGFQNFWKQKMVLDWIFWSYPSIHWGKKWNTVKITGTPPTPHKATIQAETLGFYELDHFLHDSYRITRIAKVGRGGGERVFFPGRGRVNPSRTPK